MKMSYKVITLSLLILLSFISAGKIIPDSQNPVQILNPTESKSNNIVLKFSVSTPLKYSEVIIVSFAPTFAATYSFNSNTLGGSLVDSSGIVYTITQVKDASLEQNYAIFKLADNVDITVPKGRVLTLSFAITNPTTPDFINSVGIFTATDSTRKRIIIDSNPVIGTGAIFPDVSTGTTQDLVINSVTKISPSGSTGTTVSAIYGSNTFDLNITLTVNNYITKDDHVIVIQYPKAASVTAPTGIATYNTTNDNLGKPLGGTIGLTVGTNPADSSVVALYVTGVTEDLSAGRTFILTLIGFTAGNAPSAQEITVLVYYKNTYIVTSSSKSSSGALTVAASALTVTAAHVDGWDLIRNGAYPIKFKITAGVTILPVNSYVVIKNVATATSIFSFIASTCDFSDAVSGFSNGFDTRANCYSLENHQHKNSADFSQNPSGIFFRLNQQVAAGASITVTVWGYVDQCAGDNIRISGTIPIGDATDPLSPKSAATKSSTINFTVSVLSSINPNIVSTATRFASASTLATGTPTGIKCWDSLVSDSLSDEPRVLKNDLQADATTDIMFLREISTWDIATETGKDDCSSGTSCYISDIVVNNSAFTAAFLYGDGIVNNLSTSYFLAKATISTAKSQTFTSSKLTAPFVSFYQYVPSPYYVTIGSATTNVNNPVTVVAIFGQLQILFSSGWFTDQSASQTCTATWAMNGVDDNSAEYQGAALTQTSLKYSSSSKNGLKKAATPSPGTGDLLQTVVNTNGAFTINSVIQTTEVFSFFSDAKNALAFGAPASGTGIGTSTTSKIYLSFYTSCLKWSTISSASVKSLYTYIDIQYRYLQGASSALVPSKTIRLLKLYPQGGVFNDPTAKTPTSSTTLAVAPKFHININGDSSLNSGFHENVCLVEIDYLSINRVVSAATSNALVFWIHGLTLINLDYSTTSITYPVAPLDSPSVAYGTQATAPALSTQNNYISLYSSTSVVFDSILTKVNVYHHFMGSSVIIRTPSSTLASAAKNYLIPVICPGYNSKINTLSIVGATFSTSSYTDFIFKRFFSFAASPTFSANTLTTLQLLTAITTALPTLLPLQVMPRFNGFGISATSDSLLIYNYIFGSSTAGSVNSCTGFSLFASSVINVSTSATVVFAPVTTVQTVGVVKNSSASYYIEGGSYTQAVLAVTSTAVTVAAGVSTTAFATYSGITKPTLAAWTTTRTNGYTNLSNALAFNCASSVAGATNGLTNFNTANFYLDWASPLSSDTTALTLTITAENSDTVYNGDNGSLLFTVKTSYSLPNGAAINLVNSGTPLFNTETLCGITATAGTALNTCTTTATPTPITISCPVPTYSTTSSVTAYYIYCYGVTTATSMNIGSIVASINVDTTDTTGVAILTNNAGNGAVPTALTASPITVTAKASIAAYSYSYSNQELGLGKLSMQVTLPRSLVRNSKVTISGLPSNMAITNVSPRCAVSTSTNGFNLANLSADTGDIILSTCVVDLTSGTITVDTKTDPVIGGLVFGKNLYISVWPIYTPVSPISTTPSSTLLTVAYNSKGTTQASLIGTDSTSLPVPTTGAGLSGVFNKPTIQEGVCTVTTGSTIAGVYNPMTLTVDLNTNKLSFNTTVFPNEVVVYFPIEYFGTSFDLLSCIYNTNPVNCAFVDEGLLSIKFGATIVTSTNTAVITIYGARIPEIPAATAYGACSVNNYNINTGVSANLIVGSITFPTVGAIPTTLGNIKLYSTSSSATSTIAKSSSSTINLRVGIDRLNPVSFPVALTKPILMISFPSDYNLALNKVTSPSVTVTKYTSTVTASTATTTIGSSTIAGTTTVSGNTIMFAFTADQSITANDLYYDILINGVNTPPSAEVTSLFEISLVNSDSSAVFRSSSSNYNTVGTGLTTPIDALLTNNRGFNIIDEAALTDTTGTFANNWNLVIRSVSGDVNQITVRPGRYNVAWIDTSYITSDYTHTSTAVSLTSTTFGLLKTQYTYATAYLEPIQFYIGTTCSTLPGNYIVSFTLTGGNFKPMAPVQIYVAPLTKAIVTVSAPSLVAKGSIAYISLSTSELNFDNLNVGFYNANSQYVITNGTIPQGKGMLMTTFTDNNGTLTTSQSFTTSLVSNCFSINTPVTITPSLVITNITNTTLAASQFTALNFNNDSTIARDAIRVSYTPTVGTTMIKCALACSNGTVPSDNALSSAYASFNNPSLQYYMDNVIDTTKKTFTFSNLLIGQSYMLKCLLTTATRDPTATNVSSLVITNLTATSNISTSIISPTKCSTFTFPSSYSLTNATKTRVLNYCQNLAAGYNGTNALAGLSSYGYFSNGCLVCTDYAQTMAANGLTIPSQVTCNSTLATMTSRRVLRFLQSNTTNATNATNPTNTTKVTVPTATSSFTICVSQNPLCPNIGTSSLRSADALISNLQVISSGASFASIINIAGVSSVSSSSSSDATTPNASLVVINNLTNTNLTFINWYNYIPSGGSDLACRWMVTPASSAAPSFSTVTTCTSALCGSSVVTPSGSYTGPGTLSSANALSSATTYSIYYACKNNVNNAQLQSNVTLARSFATSSSNTPTDPGTTAPTTSTSSSNSTSSSSYLSYSFYAFVTIIALLFN